VHLPDLAFQTVNLPAHLMEPLVIVRLDQLVALDLQFANLDFQITLRVGAFVRHFFVWLFDAEKARHFLYKLGFVLPVNAFNTFLVSLLSKLDDRHLFQIMPFYISDLLALRPEIERRTASYICPER
jgi:hypothetical protein